MTRKFAIPTSGGKLDQHFGHCRQFALVEVENSEILGTALIDAPPHEPGRLPPWLAERGTTDVIAGGLGERARTRFGQLGIRVYAGAPRKTPQDLVLDFLNGKLTLSDARCHH